MTVKYGGSLLVASAIISLAFTGFSAAQQGQPRQVQPNQPRQGQPGVEPRGVQRPGNAQVGASWGDSQIVECLIMENQNEIELARIAQRQAKSDDVKKFAQMMIDEHGAFIKELQQYKGGAQPAVARDRQPRPEGPGAVARPQRTDFVAIHREIGEKCLAATKAELESKEGKEFDQCFMAQQAMCHMKMVATLEVLQNHVSSELREVLSEGRDTAKKHLDKAKELVKTLDGDSSDQTAARDSERAE